MHAKGGSNAEKKAVNALNGPNLGWADGEGFFFITLFNNALFYYYFLFIIQRSHCLRQLSIEGQVMLNKHWFIKLCTTV